MLAGFAVVLILAAGVWVLTQRETVQDPRIQGRRLSEWFRVLVHRPWLGDPHRPTGDPDIEAALAAFREAGTNALPLLVAETRATPKDPLAARLGRWVRRVAPRSFVPRGLTAPVPRSGMARRVLAHLAPPAAVLLPALEADLSGGTPQRQALAIHLLGKCGEGGDLAAARLRPFLVGTNTMTANAAVNALADLGPAATHAVAELTALLDGPFPTMLPAALGHCGTLAESAVPRLEAHLEGDRPLPARLSVAIALLRIRPGHPTATALLESVVSPEGRGTNDPTALLGLAHAVRLTGRGAPSLAPWVERVLDRGTNLAPTVRLVLLGTINDLAPAATDRYLRDLLGGALRHQTAVNWAVHGLQLQPTNRLACSILVAAAVSNGPPAMAAAQALGLAMGLLDSEVAELERRVRDPNLDPQQREALRQSLRAIALRRHGLAPSVDGESVP